MDFAHVVAGLAAIAATVTATVAIVRRFINGPNDDRFSTTTWPVLALLVGVGYCLGWQLNLAPAFFALVPALVGHASRLTGVAGQVLTGLAAGASAGFLHDFFDFIRSKTV